jgi:hypothetical protein
MSKFAFALAKNPSLFLEIFQGYGVSRHVLSEWVRPFKSIVVAFVFTSQLLDP